MTKRDLDPVIGRAVFADGVGTVLATSVGGSLMDASPWTVAAAT